MVFVWVLLAVAFLALEAAVSTAFYALFLAVGFGAAAVAAVVGAPAWMQLVVAAVADLGGLAVARPPLARRLTRTALPLGSPSAMLGQSALTLDEVGDEHHPGHALYRGERWLAVTIGAPLPAHSQVIVCDIRGTTLVVVAEGAVGTTAVAAR